jgi:hypothetical protein
VDLTSRCRAAGIINGGLSGAALQKAQNKAAEMSVRCINSNVCKDSYNEAIEMAILHLKLLLLLELWLLLCGKLLNTLLIS